MSSDRDRADADRPTVAITPRAETVISDIADDQDRALSIALNDGCCDGMGPVLIHREMVGVSDVRIGGDETIDVFTPPNRDRYRAGYDITIDVTETTGGEGSFSLELPYGYRLIATERKR